MTGPDGKELRVPAKLEEIDRVRDFLLSLIHISEPTRPY